MIVDNIRLEDYIKTLLGGKLMFIVTMFRALWAAYQECVIWILWVGVILGVLVVLEFNPETLEFDSSISFTQFMTNLAEKSRGGQ